MSRRRQHRGNVLIYGPNYRQEQKALAAEEGKASRLRQEERAARAATRSAERQARIAREEAATTARLASRRTLVYKNTGLVYGRNHAIQEVTIKWPKGIKPSIVDVRSVCKEIAAKYPGHQLKVLTLGGNGPNDWRTGQWFTAGQEPKVFDPAGFYDESQFDQGEVYKDKAYFSVERELVDFRVIIGALLSGGCAGEHNDCLFRELCAAYEGISFPKLGRTSKLPATPAALKLALTVGRDDCIPLAKIEAVERLYKVNIVVTGDGLYEGANVHQRTLRLTLVAGHYKLEGPPKYPIVNVIPIVASPVLFCFGADPFVYSDKGRRSLTASHLGQILHGKPPACRHIGQINGRNGKSLEAQLTEWKAERAALLPYGVDMYVTPKYVDCALLELERHSRVEMVPLPLEQQQWVSDATRGGLIWAKAGDYPVAASLDVVSMYPHILMNGGNLGSWPVKPGEFQTLEGKVVGKLRDGALYWPYGIYRVKAHSVPYPDSVPMYRWTSNGHYTHHDLSAIEEATGVTPELVQDGRPNALIWTSQQRGFNAALFGAFATKWFALKAKGVPGAKKILTCLWGMLSQRARSTRTMKSGTITGVLEDITPAGSTAWNVTTRPIDRIYSGRCPGVAPFVTSLARLNLARMMREHGTAHIVRCHTDSFVTTLANEQWGDTASRLGSAPGDLKIEKQGAVAIAHANAAHWR